MDNNLNWSDVESSNLAAVAYQANELFVRFKNGNVFRYDRVPAAIYDGLLGAESKGQYFNAEIKGKYASNQVASADSPVEGRDDAGPKPDNENGKTEGHDPEKEAAPEKEPEAGNPDSAPADTEAPQSAGEGEGDDQMLLGSNVQPSEFETVNGRVSLGEIVLAAFTANGFQTAKEWNAFVRENDAEAEALIQAEVDKLELVQTEREPERPLKAHEKPSAPPRLPPAEPEKKVAGIARVADTSNQLFITFHDGRIYRYDGLPRRFAEGLILAGDRDAYWKSNIEPHYKPAVMETAAA